jgi:hypothetical protein
MVVDGVCYAFIRSVCEVTVCGAQAYAIRVGALDGERSRSFRHARPDAALLSGPDHTFFVFAHYSGNRHSNPYSLALELPEELLGGAIIPVERKGAFVRYSPLSLNDLMINNSIAISGSRPAA